jgi:hypothetical protein
MRRVVLFPMISVAIAGLGIAVIESCGAMAFELPPEEPLPEASGPPRLVRPEGGTPEVEERAPPLP